MSEADDTVDWAAVWSDHGEAMLGAARVIMRGRVADGYTDGDIVSEVLADMIKSPGGFQQAENQRAYLIGAVQNRCMSKLKRGKRQIVRNQTDEDDGEPSERSPAHIPDPVGDAGTDAALASAIAGCLDRLTDKQQTAIRRRVMNDERPIDIAADMGCTAAMVSQHVNAGFERLRRDPTFITLTAQLDADEEQP
jgi:RNA polymerase sigma factor (sigma-70 family)